MASAGLALDPLTPVVANNNIYVNKKLGIAFRVPEEWHFCDVKAMEKMHDAQIVKPDASLIDECLDELKNEPLVAISLHPTVGDEESYEFSPSIVLRLENKEDGFRLENCIDYSGEYLNLVVRNFKRLQNLPIANICGYQSVQGKYTYLFEAEHMNPTPITGRSCIIEMPNHYYSFNMYNYVPENLDIDRSFNRLLSSIMIL